MRRACDRLLFAPGAQRVLGGLAGRTRSEAGRPIPAPGPYNVSISHRHEFVWFRVAKAGTRSIIAALDAAGPGVIDAELSGAVVPHWALRDYTAWAFVRDPVERLESCWRDKVRDTNTWRLDDEQRTPHGFVEWVAGHDLWRCNRHFRLQRSLVDLRRVALIGRVESFDEDLERIFDRIGLPFRGAPSKNRTTATADTRWPRELRSTVRELYAADCEVFGYR